MAIRIKARNLLCCCLIICRCFARRSKRSTGAGRITSVRKHDAVALAGRCRLPIICCRGRERAPTRSMRRHALEVTVQAAFGPLRIVNTHLEYHSADQREAQIARLLDLQQEASTSSKRRFPSTTSLTGVRRWRRRACCAVISTSTSSDRQHALIDRSARPGLNYRDAWSICHPGQPRSPTCGLYDHAQWTRWPGLSRFHFHDRRFDRPDPPRRSQWQDRRLRSSAYPDRIG